MDEGKLRSQAIRVLWILIAVYIALLFNWLSATSIPIFGGFEFYSARLTGLTTIIWYLMPFFAVLIALLLGLRKLRIIALLLGAFFVFFSFCSLFPIYNAIQSIRFDKDETWRIVERKEIGCNTYRCVYEADFLTRVGTVVRVETELLPGLRWIQTQ